MIRYKNIVFILLTSIVVLSGCKQEDPLDIGPFVLESSTVDTTTVLGKKIHEFKQKYNSEIIYHWDSNFLGSGAIATPPYYEKVYDFILFMEEVWLKPYNDEDFLKDHLPREIVLVGSDINYGENSGTSFSAAGFAESQYRIVLGGVNDYSTDFDVEEEYDYRSNLHVIMHHEFAHILSRIYDLPEGYEKISKGLYLNATHHSSLAFEDAIERGFVRPYGATNELEDFATLVEVMVTKSHESIVNSLYWRIVDKDYQIGDVIEYEPLPLSYFPLIEQKYYLALEFYNSLGIDINSIGAAYEAYEDGVYESIASSTSSVATKFTLVNPKH